MTGLLKNVYRWLLDRSVYARLWLRWILAHARALVSRGGERIIAPRGFWRSTRRWYESLPPATRATTHVYRIFEAQSIELGSADKLDSRLIARAATRCPEIFVVGIENGRVYGQTGEVVGSDGRIIADLSLMHPERVMPWVRRLHKPFNSVESAPITALGRACTVTTQYAESNYFHWMLNALPRLHLFEMAGLDLDTFDSIVTNQLRMPFHKETLHKIGVPLSSVVESGPAFCGEADVLFATRSLRSSGQRSRWALDYTRSLFADCLSPPDGIRIYVTRGDAPTRRISNEEEVMTFLEKFGFRPYSLSCMTVSEQARLFSSASIVVAPHGAGLTNLIFCHADTTVIELLSARFLKTYYVELSAAMGLRYSCVISDDEAGDAASDNGDYAIALKELGIALHNNML